MPANTLPPDLTDPGYATPASNDLITAEPSVTTATAAAPQKPLERGDSLGRYIILRTLGEGGMGIVYAAYDPELDRRVAVKLLRPSGHSSPERQMRLMREAQALARISHPNVIAVYDVGTHNDNVFVAMELVESGTLTDWLEEKKRTPREIISMFCDAGKGLAAAHAAGMIHRDFKPENVLVGKDGRCHVTDFGLARLATSSDGAPIGEADRLPTDTGKVINQRLTRAGAVVGTPLFMSWEQFQGQPADQRSDQYNYCASLYWALFGAPPPGPYTSADSRESTAETPQGAAAVAAWKPQRLRDLPKEPRLPAPVRRALLRGLSLKPEDRFPAMGDLLRELGRDPRVAQRRGVIAGGLVLAIVLAGLTYAPVLQQQRQLCRGAERKLDGIWTRDVQVQMEEAFKKTGSTLAEETSNRVSAGLDRYSTAWAAMHTDACEATRIRGEQSDQILALRMICLDRRLQQLGALTKLFRSPDAKVVEKAHDAVLALPSVAGCADIAALTAPIARPEGEAARAKLSEVERGLAEVRALQDSARYKTAHELTTALLTKAGPDAWPPLQAELLELHGWLTYRVGDAAGGARTLREALVWAEKGRDDDEKIKILAKLVYLEGTEGGRFEDALYWGQLGEALSTRSNNTEAKLSLALRIGTVHTTTGNNEAARTVLERAAILCDETLGRESLYMGLLLKSLADAYGRMGDYQRALELLTTSLGITERTRGPHHPDVAWVHRSLAYVLYRLGEYDQAHQHIQTSIKLFSEVYNPEHLSVADALDYLSTILHLDGLDAEALDEATRALNIKSKAQADDVSISFSLCNRGQALLGLRRYQEALVSLEKAAATQEAAKLASEEIAEVRFAYAQALWETKKDRARAMTLARQAREGFRRGHDKRAEEEAERWLAARVAEIAQAKGRR